LKASWAGQARVLAPPASARLDRHVNQLAANLDDSGPCHRRSCYGGTKGDLNPFIAVEAQGEVAALKDKSNEMIVNLAATTLRTTSRIG